MHDLKRKFGLCVKFQILSQVVCIYTPRGRREFKSALQTTRLKIGQNGTAKKSGLASGHRAIARDTVLNDWHESTAHFEKPAELALALATEPQSERQGLFIFIPINSLVANVAIAHFNSLSSCLQ